MRKIYKIVGQDFSDNHKMGVRLRIKNLYSGEVFYKTPLEIFNDKILLKKLPPVDVLRIGYMVGEYQTSLSYKFIIEKRVNDSEFSLQKTQTANQIFSDIPSVLSSNL